MEQLNQVEICRMWSEVLLENEVDGRLEHEGIVDCNHAHARLPVPARLSSPCDTRVHNVVADEKEGLQEFGQPSKGG